VATAATPRQTPNEQKCDKPLDQERRWRLSARSNPTRFLADGSPARHVDVAEPASRPPLQVPAVA
jgi:hypothetical protein